MPLVDFPLEPEIQAPPLHEDNPLEGVAGVFQVAKEGGDIAEVEDSEDEMTEKAPNQLPLDKFESGKDDIDDWIERFEKAVRLATNAQSAARRNKLYLEWLPLWIDEPARAVLGQIPTGTVYQTANDVKGVKDLLKELLVDPNEVYQWRAMKKKVTWDGKEDFQVLATRVIRAVDKYEKDLDQNARNSSYFFRFREALPKVYKDSIDVSLNKDERTIENAKELATRVRGTQPNHEVSFEAAAMVDSPTFDNRVRGLELQVSELGKKIDSLGIGGEGDRNRERGSSRDRRSGHPDSRRGKDNHDHEGYSGRRDSRDRGRDRYGDRYDRDYRHNYSPEYRRDSSYHRRRNDERDWNRRGDDRDSGHDRRNDRADRGYSGRRRSPSPPDQYDLSPGWRSRDGYQYDDQDNFRAMQSAGKSSKDDFDSTVLAACVKTLKKKKSTGGRSKRSGQQGNE